MSMIHWYSTSTRYWGSLTGGSLLGVPYCGSCTGGLILGVLYWRLLTGGCVLGVASARLCKQVPQRVPEVLTVDIGCSEAEALPFRGALDEPWPYRSAPSAGCSWSQFWWPTTHAGEETSLTSELDQLSKTCSLRGWYNDETASTWLESSSNRPRTQG